MRVRPLILALTCLSALPALAQKPETKSSAVAPAAKLPVPPVPPALPEPPPVAPPPADAPAAMQIEPALRPPEPTAIGTALEGFAYPYLVRFHDFVWNREDVRMAYMDVAALEPSAPQPDAAPAVPGATKTVILLHGRTLPSFTWAGLIGALSAAGTRVVVPDQLGFFKSSKPAAPVTFDDQVRQTLALMDELGIAQADVVGQGMGAMLAVRLARAAPDRVRRVVLAAPLGLEDYRLSVPPASTDALIDAERARTPEAFRAAIQADAGPHFPAVLLNELVAWREGFRQSGEYPRFLRATANQEQVLYQEPVAHEITLVEAPALFLLGRDDHAAPGRDRAPEKLRGAMGQNAALARTLADRMRAAQVTVLDDVGHFPAVEAPDAFNAAVLKFLQP